KQGVAQVLNRMTYPATISHLRRVNTPIEKSGKLVQPRKLHPSQFGIICPCECFDPETPVLMWSGVIKRAEDIVVGDYLIDDKGKSVRVRSTCAGYKTMYDVVPDKRSFMKHTVTDNHILTLKVRDPGVLNGTGITVDSDNVIDITIEEYLVLPDNIKSSLYIFKSNGIHWEHKEVDADPYDLGMWLGDDRSTVIDDAYLNKYHLSYDSMHIPLDYIVNDRKTRLALLAGLIDASGLVNESSNKITLYLSRKLLYDAEFLARSLGFGCDLDTINCVLTITGNRLLEIPTVNTIKTNDNHLQTCFKLVERGVQPFVGWQVEGNGRFLLGDMTTVHNTPEGASVVIT
ncbi:hypothetical protein EBT25_18435, partial [bacterium]|nr:hypothetical protein [bacterium]